MNYLRVFSKIVCFGVALLIITGSAKAQDTPPAPVRDYWPTDGWKESTPEQQGMDSQTLAKMKPYIEKELPTIRSVLIVRHGYLAYEQYFQYFNREYKQNIIFVNHSITSALVGIALKEGSLRSLDQKLVDFYPEYVTPEVDPRVRQITLKHLLTMSSGFDKKDIYWKTTREKIQQKPVHEPGEIFNYDKSAADFLSSILIKTTHMSLLDFTKDKLFAPLGISDVIWEFWPDKSFDIGSFDNEVWHYWGLSLKPRDMAKFGYLYLHNGIWDGKQVVPSDFVRDSIQKHINTPYWGGSVDYGYLWWINKVEGHAAYCAAGPGQYIYVIPDQDMVIVITSGREEPIGENMSIIAKWIVPATLKK